jgi:hypothetical protein
MLVDIISVIVSLILVVLGLMVVMTSTEMLSERRRQYREGTHDYYGNKIEDEEDK